MKPKHVKRVEAEERNKKWSSLSPQQQLVVLNNKGLKAVKQRAKIERKSNVSST